MKNVKIPDAVWSQLASLSKKCRMKKCELVAMLISNVTKEDIKRIFCRHIDNEKDEKLDNEAFKSGEEDNELPKAMTKNDNVRFVSGADETEEDEEDTGSDH